MDASIFTPLSTNSEPLDIRLLRVQPSLDPDAPIQCSLFTYTLRDLGERPHLYEALSYVWGDPTDVKEITISGLEIKVTRNLHTALRRLRDHYFERFLWVDAVCIDQDNKDEVAQQILSMTKIYSQASRVLVWLGEAADDSDVAMEHMLSTSSNREHLTAMQRLLARPWFSRIWVLQEVATARHIRILCGEKELDGYALYKGLHQLSKHTGVEHPSAHLLSQATFRSASSLAYNSWPRVSVGNYSLGELFDLYHEYGATKRHDKIYALLGMSTDVTKVGLKPDYSVPWLEIFRHVIQYLLSKSIHIRVWQNKAIATIHGQLSIIGSLTERMEILRDGKRRVGVRQFCDGTIIDVDLSASAKQPCAGDVLCLFQKARRASILRPCSDHFLIIAINVSLRDHDCPRNMIKCHDIISMWDWEIPRQELSDVPQQRTIPRLLGLMKSVDAREKCARIIGVATILCDLQQYAKTLESLDIITGDEALLRCLEDVQVEELMRMQIICHVRLRQRRGARRLLLTGRLKPYGRLYQGGLCAVIDKLSVDETDYRRFWSKMEKLVGLLEVRKDEITDKKLLEMAAYPYHEAISYLLRKRSALFHFPEMALFTILASMFNRAQLYVWLKQLLIQKHETEKLNLERILELTAGLVSGSGAMVRYILAPSHYNFKVTLPTELPLWGHEEDSILRLFSCQQEEGIHVTDTMREAAAGSATQALNNLVGLICGPQIQLTEDMLRFAARYGEVPLMEGLLTPAHQSQYLQITDKILTAATLNRRSGYRIIHFLVTTGTIEFSFAESYLQSCFQIALEHRFS